MTEENWDDFGWPAQKTRVRITVPGQRAAWRRGLPITAREQRRKSFLAMRALLKNRAGK